MEPTAIPLSYFLKKLAPAERASFKEIYLFGAQHLTQVLRRTGVNYFIHGTEVAKTLFEINPDAMLGRVLVLHDLLVHPDGESLLKKAPLTAEERTLVRSMNALRRLHIDESTKDLDYVINEFSEDQRLLVMRMAHRLNDIRHFNRFDSQLRDQIAHESLNMYTALAGRLGLHAWRYEMEDACFRFLYPSAHKKLAREFEESHAQDEACLTQTRRYLMEAFKKQGILANVQMRVKSVYSTYRKMVQKKRSFHELTDRLALRIVVDQLEDCYRVLGTVHRVMHPIPGKLKDYIGAPKENGYQSIHTVVYPLPGITELPMEIQIRTRHMDEVCEYGIAAHHLYKENVYALGTPSSRVNLFRNLAILKTQAASPKEFETALRSYFQEENLIVFDGLNNLYHLKRPATALDFACLVYGKRSKKIKKVRINGRERGVSTLLRD